MELTADGGYVVAGLGAKSDPEHGYTWVLKLNARGESEWERTHEGFEDTRAIDVTSDGGYVLAGLTGWMTRGLHDAWVLKLDQDGKLNVEASATRQIGKQK